MRGDLQLLSLLDLLEGNSGAEGGKSLSRTGCASGGRCENSGRGTQGPRGMGLWYDVRIGSVSGRRIDVLQIVKRLVKTATRNQLFMRSLIYYATFIDHENSIGNCGHEIEIMADQDAGALVRILANHCDQTVALVGIQSYSRFGDGANVVAKVGDVAITQPEYDAAQSEQMERFRQMFGMKQDVLASIMGDD